MLLKSLSCFRNFSSTQALLNSVTNPKSISEAVELLSTGPGFIIYTGLIPETEIDEIQTYTKNFVNSKGFEVLDAHNVNQETGHNRIYSDKGKQGVRMWDLVPKHEIFEKWVQLEPIMSVLDKILGHDFCLGSFAGNHLFPGAMAQSPHLDYPYWDYDCEKTWPVLPKRCGEHPFFMNCQTAIMVDDFTEENGATSILPYSQRELSWPNEEVFWNKRIQVTGKAGSVLVFTGLLHHAGSTNFSDGCRTSVLGQY